MYWVRNNLGTCAWDEKTPHGVTVVDVRDLSDHCNPVEKVAEKVYLVDFLMAHGYRVVVRCVAGMNRSNAIAITTLALREERYFDDVEYEVRKKVGRCLIHTSMRDCCRQFLGEIK